MATYYLPKADVAKAFAGGGAAAIFLPMATGGLAWLDAAEAEQFLREARAAAQIRHPNIVAVHELGREDGSIYIVSDFVEGANLSEWLTGQRLTPRPSCPWLRHTAPAHIEHHRDHRRDRARTREDIRPDETPFRRIRNE